MGSNKEIVTALLEKKKYYNQQLLEDVLEGMIVCAEPDKKCRTLLENALASLVRAKEWANNSRRLIAQTPEPLVDGAKLTSNIETPAIAVSSDVLTLLTLVFAFFLGFLFYRCVKARRSRPRVLAYPVGLLGAPIEARQNLASNHDDA